MKRLSTTAMLLSLLLVSCGEEPKLYLRTVQWGLGGLELSWIYLDESKGLIVKNPRFGVNPLDEGKERAENPATIGSYELKGDRMHVKWADGNENDRGAEFKDGELSAWDAGLCIRAKPFTYRHLDDLTYEGNLAFGNVSNNTTIRFGKDGRFSMRAMGAVSGTDLLQGAISETPEQTGAYDIEGNTITFKYDDGKVWQAVAHPMENENRDLIIGTMHFKLVR